MRQKMLGRLAAPPLFAWTTARSFIYRIAAIQQGPSLERDSDNSAGNGVKLPAGPPRSQSDLCRRHFCSQAAPRQGSRGRAGLAHRG
jgi:hypothetical protein